MRYLVDSRATKKIKTQTLAINVLKRLCHHITLLILAWVCMIWWGERLIFSSSLAACQWHHWEKWPSEANPHHVVLIADPQLVDPHTYPGRPWPLSSLTIAYTDLYLRRSYRYLQQYLQPDTIFFLGDLFDGGREWATSHSSSPEEQYKRYGDRYWMQEYTRFQSIFIDRWLDDRLTSSSAEPRGRKLIASLPGNHDLGFASAIQGPVKARFEAYFGNGNRIDIIGNHSFISVDTVSLSAMDQVDPHTGSSGAGDGTSSSAANHDIWASTEDFLSAVKQGRNRAVKRELRMLAGLDEQNYHDDQLAGFAPNVSDVTFREHAMEKTDLVLRDAANLFPSILLTHVPLYRPPETDCGTQRERGHAIPIQAGYQYQNALTPLVSKDIISKLGVEHVRQVYSGDDHDYCEIEHGEFTGRIKEITVKSISMAMGVRKPGFLAVSLHNPVHVQLAANLAGQESSVKRDTIQNKLCLLPDQLTIFTKYAVLLILTLLLLAIKEVSSSSSSSTITTSEEWSDGKPLLPLTKEKSPHPPFVDNGLLFRHAVTSTSSSTPDQPILTNGTISTAYRTPRSASSSLGGYGNLTPSLNSKTIPGATIRGTDIAHDDDDRGMPQHKRTIGQQRKGIVVGFGHSLARVAVPVLAFYLWLVWSG